jgi:hypothetical protein
MVSVQTAQKLRSAHVVRKDLTLIVHADRDTPPAFFGTE